MSLKSKIDIKGNKVVFDVNLKIYPQNIIFRTCYVMIDRMYIYLDKPGKDMIEIVLKGKTKLGVKKLEELRGEFSNELLNNILRDQISKKNKGIVEYIMSGAIAAALEKEAGKTDKKNVPAKKDDPDMLNIEKEIAALKDELDNLEAGGYENDPLGIRKVANTVAKKKNGRK